MLVTLNLVWYQLIHIAVNSSHLNGKNSLSPDFKSRLNRLGETPDLLTRIGRGIEKESLRIDNSGHLSQSPHPLGLGSALTHPSITTDYSEALLEFITPVSHNISDTLQQLDDVHRYVYSKIGY